jgi:hypothetical protein
MPYTVSQEIIDKTNRCKKNMECLKSAPCCRIETRFENKAAFVHCLYPGDCNYKVHFGDRVCCTCPVRMDLSKTYGI